MKTVLRPLLLSALCASLSASADLWDNAELRGTSDADPVGYKPDSPITFSISLLGIEADSIPANTKVLWTRTGDDGVTEKGEADAATIVSTPLSITTSLARPGFVRLTANLVDEKGEKIRRPKKPGQWWDNAISFDGGAGASIETLQSQPEPDDFDAYWKRQLERLAAVPVQASRTELPSNNPAVRVYAVAVDCAGPRPVTGYLTIPTDASTEKRYPARAQFQGYGTNTPKAPGWLSTSEIVFEVNAHGVDLEKDADYYKSFFDSIHPQGYSYAFSPDENKDPDTAYFNGMALRVVRAFDYLKSLPEWNGQNLIAAGGSQGGLQTLWAAGLVKGLTFARPDVPWCCDLAGASKDGRLAAPWRVPYVPAIEYYDPVHHARRIPSTCTVYISRAGLGDYTCPPSGIATLYNNITAPVSINWVQGSTHGYVPPEPRQSTTLQK